MNIGRITRAAAAALSKPATLTRKVAWSEGAGGALRASTQTNDVQAHWVDYSETMRRLGVPEGLLYAHVPDPGFSPCIDDILTLGGQRMIISVVKRAPEGGVFYLGGNDGAAAD